VFYPKSKDMLFDFMENYIDTRNIMYIHFFVFEPGVSMLFSGIRGGGRAVKNYMYFNVDGAKLYRSASSLASLFKQGRGKLRLSSHTSESIYVPHRSTTGQTYYVRLVKT
jgi:hypothetical protein